MQPVLIIGAGIAGLTLAQCLRVRSIPAIVFEAKPKGKFGNHGLWLGGAACRTLSEQLKMSLADLHKQIAVTSELGVPRQNPEDSQGIRANKRRLLDLLSANLDIRWEHKLKSIDVASAGAEECVTATFENGQSSEGSLLVGADGVHSSVRRELLTDVKPSVLPFVAFNGQRRTPLATYEEETGPALHTANTVRHDNDKQRCIARGLNDVKGKTAYHYWVYSRPAGIQQDPLFTPDRSTQEASTIPSELYDELEQTAVTKDLTRESLKEDRILSWLMRSVKISENDLKQLPTRVGLIGDAAHGTPILGGDGGEQAIQDAHNLAIALADAKSQPERALNAFVQGAVRRWEQSVESSEGRLRSMHHL